MPLEASFWSLGVRLFMPVSPVSSDGGLLPAQMLLVDTGSSSLFCHNLLQEAAYQKTQYNSCNRYNPGGAPMFYWGPLVEGDIHAGNVTFQNVSYSITTGEEKMSCQHGIQGIFGLAFRSDDIAFPAKPNCSMADCRQDRKELKSRRRGETGHPLVRTAGGEPGPDLSG